MFSTPSRAIPKTSNQGATDVLDRVKGMPFSEPGRDALEPVLSQKCWHQNGGNMGVFNHQKWNWSFFLVVLWVLILWDSISNCLEFNQVSCLDCREFSWDIHSSFYAPVIKHALNRMNQTTVGWILGSTHVFFFSPGVFASTQLWTREEKIPWFRHAYPCPGLIGSAELPHQLMVHCGSAE